MGNTISRLCSVSQMKPNSPPISESEVVRAEAPIRAKRKSSKMGSTSKIVIEPEKEMVEVDLTSKEAQELVRPPLGSDVPTTVVIDGVEFTAYEGEPVIGRPSIIEIVVEGMVQWSQCEQCYKWRKVPFDVVLPARWTCSQNQWDPQRSKCSDREEMMSDETIKKRFPTSSDQGPPKKRKIVEQQPETAVAPDTTVAVIADENAKASSKHPRHRPGCNCIVCVQAPSGTKHNSTCTCSACINLRRRHQTVNSRRTAKKPSGPIRRKRTRRAGKQAAKNQKKPSTRPQPDNSVIGKQAEVASSASSSHQEMEVAQQPTSVLKPITEDHQITESSSASIQGDTSINERFLFDLNMMPEPEEDEE